MTCVAAYNYSAMDGEELTISKGENLSIVDDQGQWWKVKNREGRVGLVPSNYVKVETQQVNSAVRSEPQTEYHQPPDNIAGSSPSLNIKARARYTYKATNDDEINLTKGDEVIVMEKEADGWWKGRNGVQIGWFPFNYVEEVEEEAAPVQSQAQPEAPKSKSFICGVVALYSFNSGNPEELHFEKGDLMDIVDQPDDDPDWWEARTSSGKVGLVPRNYVEVVQGAESVIGTGNNGASNAEPSATGGIAAGPNAPPFAREVWYHGKMSRRDAENILNSRAENGQFIVRASETKPGDYSISMKAPDKIKHFNIKVLPDNRFGIGQRKFDSVDELIQHYRRAPIYTTVNEGKMYLGTGLPKR